MRYLTPNYIFPVIVEETTITNTVHSVFEVCSDDEDDQWFNFKLKDFFRSYENGLKKINSKLDDSLRRLSI